MIKNEKEKADIYETLVNVQKVDSDGNVVSVSVDKMYIGVKNKILQNRIEQVSKDYFSLERIDNDIYIFGEISVDPLAVNYPEQYDNNFSANIRYGILKLTRDKEGNIIPMKEKIISQAIYDEISQNNDKTVTVTSKGYYAYFDYVKGIQLTPVVLKHAVPFNVSYEGFAECSTKDKSGYLPRNVIPVTKEQDIKLLDEKQVEILTKYQVEIDTIVETDQLYNDITGCSYTHRKK